MISAFQKFQERQYLKNICSSISLSCFDLSFPWNNFIFSLLFRPRKKKRTSRCIYCPPYCHFVYQYSKYFLLILANDRHLFICLWRGLIHHLDRKSPRWAFIQDNDFLSGFQNRSLSNLTAFTLRNQSSKQNWTTVKCCGQHIMARLTSTKVLSLISIVLFMS